MSSQRTAVLFVCLGNICRSPMAEGIFRKLVRDRGVADQFIIDSAGTAAYHQGSGADPRSMAVLHRNDAGFDHVARQVHDDDFAHNDVIFAMDRSNLNNLLRRCPEIHREKVVKLLGEADVKDPYYGGPEGFEVNFREISEALNQWLDAHLAGER